MRPAPITTNDPANAPPNGVAGVEPGSRLPTLVALAAALAFAGLALHAAWIETPTVDEFAHLPAGCAYWRHGSFDLYAKNPPLIKLWMALPAALNRAVDVHRPEVYGASWGPWQYGIAFMNANRPRYFDVFGAGRSMIVLLTLVCGALLHRWAQRLYGPAAAAGIACLFFLNPTVLAHGRLATVDAGCMLTILLALFALRWAYRSPSVSPVRITLAGAALGAALLAKFTAILLLPVVAILCIVGRSASLENGARRRAGRLLPRAAGDLAILLATATFVVNAGMGFDGSFRALGDFQFESAFARRVQSSLPARLPVPLPANFLLGFDWQKLDTEQGELPGYLLGRWRTDAWHYNLVAFAVKTPVLLLLLIPLGAIGFWRSGLPAFDKWTILAPLVVLGMMLSLFNRLNIGIRYLLPMLPLLLLLCGPLLRRLFEGPARPGASARGDGLRPAGRYAGRLRRVGPLLLLAHGILVASSVHPNHLTYFNWLAGGPSKGDRWLIDSNLDWGQDLYRVPDAVRRHRAAFVWLLYFGHVDPALAGVAVYDIAPDIPCNGLIAVSVNYLRGMPYPIMLPNGLTAWIGPDHAAWLRDRTPIERLGSIWLYDVRDAGPSPVPH